MLETLAVGTIAAVASKVLDMVVSDIGERPLAQRIRDKLRGASPENLAFQLALTKAYKAFSAKYFELSVSFFDETFLKRDAVSQELRKLLTVDQHPDQQKIITLFRSQFSLAPSEELDEPVKFLIDKLASEILNQKDLREVMENRLEYATRDAVTAEREQQSVALQDEIIEERKTLPSVTIPRGDFRATLIDTLDDFNPARKVKQFRGRQALRDEVGTWVDSKDHGALQGFGGIGKTALAVAVVVDHVEANPENKVVWLKAGNDDGQSILIAIGSADGFGAQQAVASVEGEQRIQLVRQILLQHQISLVVLDDVWNGQALSVVQNAMPSQTALLVTSRHRYALHKIETIYRLEDEEALAVLNTYAGRELSIEDGAELLEIVGNHPYALELAGNTLKVEPTLTPTALHKRIEDKPHEMSSNTEADESRSSIGALIETSLEAFDEPTINAFLGMGAFFAPRITPELLALYLEQETEPIENALRTLQYRGLADIDPATERQVAAYTIHDLAYSYAQAQNEDENRRRAMNACLNYTQTYNEPSLENFAGLRPELENFLGAATWAMGQGDHEVVEEFAWQLYTGSRILDYQGYSLQATQLLEMAANAAEKRGDQRDQGAHLGNLGSAYFSLGQYEKAIDHHQQALDISREIGDRRGEGADLGNLGIAYFSLGQYEKAIDHHQQALDISREIGDRRGEGADLGNLGIAYYSLGQYEKAIDHHRQALDISREIGDRRGEGSRLGNLGNAYASLGQYEKAIDHYQQALDISREIGDRRGEGSRLGNLGNAYFSLGQYQKAIDYYQQSLDISREIGDRRGEGNQLGNLGLAYRNLGQYEKAIDHHQQALDISREIGDRRNEGNQLGNLGNAYADLGQVEKAIDHYQQALDIQREIGDRRGEGNQLGNLGLAYADLGQYEKAIDRHQQALDISREIGDRRGQGNSLGNLGLAYKDLGDRDKALDHYQQARAIFDDIGVPHEVEKVDGLIADLNSPENPPPSSSPQT